MRPPREMSQQSLARFCPRADRLSFRETVSRQRPSSLQSVADVKVRSGLKIDKTETEDHVAPKKYRVSKLNVMPEMESPSIWPVPLFHIRCTSCLLTR